jgi:hypothetical protein
VDWLILVSVWLAAAIVAFGAPAYLKEKGKNLATREDIAAITAIVERIRAQAHEDTERLKADLSDVSEALIRRRDVYERLSGSLRIFIQGQFPEPAEVQLRQQAFLDSYVASWLWAPDDLIRALNRFILLNMRVPAEDNPRQRELKGAFHDVVIQMRRNAGFPNTRLTVDDFVFVNFGDQRPP